MGLVGQEVTEAFLSHAREDAACEVEEALSNRGCWSQDCKWGSPRKTHTELNDMAKKISAKARAQARKQRDKWKTKRWYTIRAPRHPWDFQRIGETIGESDEHIMGRVYEMTQQEFNGDFTKMHVILRFRVTECVGQDALTTFIGHHHQTDHIRRQIRRYRGKVDDVIDVVSTDGYLVRMKPLIITQQRVQTSVKQDMRTKTREIVIGFASKNTFAAIQTAMLDGSLEEEIRKGVKPIYPVRSVAIRKSQLLQDGVVASDGPTLDEIHAQEAREAAELKAKKAVALAEAMAEELDGEDDEIDVAVEDIPSNIKDAVEAAVPGATIKEAEIETEDGQAVFEVTVEKDGEEIEVEVTPQGEVVEVEVESDDSPDYSSMTVAELKELLKAAGKPVSGKKADLIARLND